MAERYNPRLPRIEPWTFALQRGSKRKKTRSFVSASAPLSKFSTWHQSQDQLGVAECCFHDVTAHLCKVCTALWTWSAGWSPQKRHLSSAHQITAMCPSWHPTPFCCLAWVKVTEDCCNRSAFITEKGCIITARDGKVLRIRNVRQMIWLQTLSNKSRLHVRVNFLDSSASGCPVFDFRKKQDFYLRW